jgi:predicted metal-dependent phosphoesterase TrpH
MIDLHTHTKASDGSLTPKELVALALRHKISVLAVTDHDTVDGITEAALAAAEAGIIFIPGIEIEIEFNPGEFHLLGYGLDIKAPALTAALQELKKAREERNATIASLFTSSGIGIDIEKIKTERKSSYIGRPQIAEALVAQKIVKTKQEAFDRLHK